MPRAVLTDTRRAGALALAALLALAGCDSLSFVPPPPPELASIKDPKATAMRSVELILAGGPNDDRTVWEQVTRHESGRERVVLTVTRPGDADPPSKLAALVRAASERGVSALIVEPTDAPDLPGALEEARGRGTGIVLLGRSVAAKDPAKPFPVVTHTEFEQPARRLVEAVLNRAKADGLPADGSAVVLVNPAFGPDAAGRSATLVETFKRAGVTRVDPVTFGGTVDQARAALEAKFAADPTVVAVLAHEEQGLAGAVAVHDALKGKRAFGLGGTVTVERMASDGVLAACAGLVDRNVPSLARQALKVAVQLTRGEAVPPETFLPMPFQPLTPSAKMEAERMKSHGPPEGSAPEKRGRPAGKPDL